MSESTIDTSLTRKRCPPTARSADKTARAASTPIGLESTFGFDETRTKPLSVIGHVAHPLALLAANHDRVAAWWTCESHASATSALTSSSATRSILVERAPHHLGSDRRRPGRH